MNEFSQPPNDPFHKPNPYEAPQALSAAPKQGAGAVVGFRDNTVRSMYEAAKSFRWVNLMLGLYLLLLICISVLNVISLVPGAGRYEMRGFLGLILILQLGTFVASVLACVNACKILYYIGAPLIIAIFVGLLFLVPVLNILFLLLITSIVGLRLKKNNVPVGFLGVRKKTLLILEQALGQGR